MKTFSVAFTRLKCSEILSVVYKKNGEPFFLKPHFCLSYDLSKRGKNKTSANVNTLQRDGQPSSLRRTIILFRYSAFIENERQCFVKKNYSSFNFVNNHFLRFFFRLLVTACNEKYFCLESACQVAITQTFSLKLSQ